MWTITIRRMLLAVLAAAVTGQALADVVVTADGRRLEGYVTETSSTIYIDTPHGRITVAREQVEQIIAGEVEDDEPDPSDENELDGINVDLSGFPDARRAEPIVFFLMRRLAETPPGPATIELRRQLEQWQSRSHDGYHRIGGSSWGDREDIRRRRESYLRLLSDAQSTLNEAERLDEDDPDQQRQKLQMQLRARQQLRRAASLWPDDAIRQFLLGQVSLLDENAVPAERAFSNAIGLDPMIAGFHQGRSLARYLGEDPYAAFVDAYESFLLSGHDYYAWQMLQQIMDEVPGSDIDEPLYLRAGDLLERFEPPRRTPRRSSRDAQLWVMPGENWTALAESLPIPEYDYYIHRRAAALSVTDNGVMIVDAKAIEGAAAMFIELGPGALVPAFPIRPRSRSVELPLTTISVPGYRTTAREVEQAPMLAPGDALTLYAQTLPAELGGSVLRTQTVAVTALGEAGEPLLDAELLPGECASPLLTDDGHIAGFLLGRTDLLRPGGGQQEFLGGAELLEVLDDLSYDADRLERDRTRLDLLEGVERLELPDPAYTLHIIVGVREDDALLGP